MLTRIAVDALRAIERHGAETYPNECCGALIAVNGIIVEAVSLANTATASPSRRFSIGPGDYTLAEKRAVALLGTLEGFYHSHPDEAARPSQYDLDHAWPNLAYIIISVRAGMPGDIQSWYLREDRTGFDKGELTWVTAS
ncbi:MAG TPA: M67 family metallopeptidase [Vicinamibacterales bacterium]|nr:M67 family metallopeptidase [Vicinamibacterales bacterium]